MGRAVRPGAARQLTALIADDDVAGILRGTALSLLGRQLDEAAVAVALGELADPDPLVRHGALLALEAAPLELVRAHIVALLTDDIRTIRMAAARILASAPPPEAAAEFADALAEYVESQNARADRGDSHYNLGNLYRRQGDIAKAETAHRTAIRIQPSFLLAYVNLADLYRELERDDEGERLLRAALAVVPEDAGVRHALGLVLVRRGRTDDGIEMLQQAAENAPEIPRYSYVHAVALSSTGDSQGAIDVLRRTHERHPGDIDVLFALVTMNRDIGRRQDAIRHVRKLETMIPGDSRLQSLLRQLQGDEP